MTQQIRISDTISKPLPLAVSALTADLKGQVILPGDAGYDGARTVFYGGIDHRPAVIFRPNNSTDVSRIVLAAGETGMDLSIRSGAHSVLGYGVSDGGIMLDLSNLKALQIDPEKRTAWAETGLTAGEYLQKTSAYGLATGFGDTATVGIGGITLGGGVGYLLRKYGLTIDQLLAAEIVTADGKILPVDANSNPDLFWAIRGGGGNFGVALRFKFQLLPVDRILGGILILPAEAGIIADFIALADAAPDELSTIANVMTAPPMPFLPPEVHGKTILMAMLAYAGDPADGEKVIAPIRALAKPLADMLHPMQYTEMFPAEEAGFHPIAASRTMFIDTCERVEAEKILDHIRASKAMMAAAQLRVLGGQMARVPADATAFAHRKSRIMLNIAALYLQPEEKEIHEIWAANFAAAMKQSDGGAYVNFIGDEGPDLLHAAYPGPTLDRLAEIKARYDPANLFRLNQNIPPVTRKA